VAIVRLAWRSLVNRWFTAALTVFAIAMSVALFLAVEKVRRDARTSFANTISGTDLIVGARSGATQLLLYSVFRIGNATNNMSWESYQDIASTKDVKWTIPLSLGDSHRGYRVLGTNDSYFEYYRFGRKKKLQFVEGAPFSDLFDTVIGYEVARALGYTLDQPIVISHGLGKVGFANHEETPFKIGGILARTGTPVDRTVHVSLEGIEAMHLDWQSGTQASGPGTTAEKARQMDLQPKAITAFLVGLESKMGTFRLQRAINEYQLEPLLAILPGVALQELWELMGVAEAALLIVSGFVVLAGLLGMVTVILAGLNERRREMAILRSVGAKPRHISALLMTESAILSLLGAVIGIALLYLVILLGRPLAEERFGLFIPLTIPGTREMLLLLAIVFAGVIVGLIPAIRAYRYSLADGMTIKT